MDRRHHAPHDWGDGILRSYPVVLGHDGVSVVWDWGGLGGCVAAADERAVTD